MEDTPNVQLNLNVRGLAQSATVAINARSHRLIAEGQRVFKLGLGQSPFPVPVPVVEALRTHAEEKDYLPVTGLMALRDAVAEYTHQHCKIRRSAEDVLIGPGSKELMFLLQLAYYGDLVIPTPAWVSYAPQAQIIGRHVRMVDTDRSQFWRLSADGLDTLCRNDPSRPRILIINYPANPTGCTYSKEELEALAEVARRYRVVLLSDEIYSELHHEGEHLSIAQFYPEGTIVSSGLSKWCGAGGWRLGTFVFPPRMRWLADAMAAVASETFTSTSAPIQYAAVRAFQHCDAIDEYLRRSRIVLKSFGQWAWKQFCDAGIECAEPAGAFYLFPDFRQLRKELAAAGISDSPALCERLLTDVGVAVLPGTEFGRPARELTCRLAYVDFDGKRAIEAIGSQNKLWTPAELQRYCGPSYEAIERIVAFVQAIRNGTSTRELVFSS